jgi:hypothetical protein
MRLSTILAIASVSIAVSSALTADADDSFPLIKTCSSQVGANCVQVTSHLSSVTAYAESIASDGSGLLVNSGSAAPDSVGLYVLGNGGSAIEAWGVYGDGVYATSSNATGVFGGSASVNGVMGTTQSNGASGVYGENDRAGYGVAGRICGGNFPNGGCVPGPGIAIYGDNNSTATGAWAGYFNGSVNVTQSIATGSGILDGGSLVVGGTPYCSNYSTFQNFSDARLKKNIQPMAGALESLLKLRGVTFEWKDPAGHLPGVQRGFIAQDVEKVLPDWVGEGDQGMKTIAIPGRAFEAMTVESLRALKMENEELRDRVRALEAGRRPLISGSGQGGLGLGLGLGLTALASVVRLRTKRQDV